jgi:hypothetical protein
MLMVEQRYLGMELMELSLAAAVPFASPWFSRGEILAKRHGYSVFRQWLPQLVDTSRRGRG